MKILFINSATNRTAVALMEILPGKNVRALFEKTWDSNRDEAEKLIPAISAALKKCVPGRRAVTGRIAPNPGRQGKTGRPDRILVVSGPGSFTGLRIGVTIANTMAFALKIPVSGISTFEYLRTRISEKHAKKTALLLRAGGPFAAVLLPKDKKPRRLGVAELSGFFGNNPEIKFVIGDMDLIERKKFPLPKNVSWLAEKSLLKMSQTIETLAIRKLPQRKMVEPVYLLPPKITQSKKQEFTAGTATGSTSSQPTK